MGKWANRRITPVDRNHARTFNNLSIQIPVFVESVPVFSFNLLIFLEENVPYLIVDVVSLQEVWT